jgi:type IV secretion system protein VirD4
LNLHLKPRQVIKYSFLSAAAGTGTAYISGVIGQLVGNYQNYVKSGNMFSIDPDKTVAMPNMDFTYSLWYAFSNSYGRGTLIACGAAAACLIGYLIYRNISENRDTDGRGFLQSKKGIYGTSGWMEKKEFNEVLDSLPPNESTGIPLGMIEAGWMSYNVVSLPEGKKMKLNRNIAVYGTPGCGKTRGFVFNQILSAVRRGESIICPDTKGELYETTSGLLRRYGYDVKIFNLVEFTHSDGWNCLNEIRGDQTRAQLFVDTIINNTTNGKPDPFWTNAEMNLLKALSLYVFLDNSRPVEQKNFGEVYRMICQCSEAELETLFSALPDGHPAKMPFNLYRMNANNDKVAGGVRMGLGGRLQVLQSEEVREIISHDDIDLEKPAREKCAYFIRISDQDSAFKFLSSLIFSFLFMDIIKYADTRPKRICDVPVNFILDEFTNIGEIPDFTKKLSTVRSRRVNVSMIFQSIPQLKNRYPQDQWREILDDCDTQIFLGGNGDMTTDYVAKESGEISVNVATESRNLNLFRFTDSTRNFKKSEGVGKRLLMTSDEVRRLSNKEEIVILRGQKPLKLLKYDYSYNPMSKRLVPCKIIDYKPEWQIAKEKDVEIYVPKEPDVFENYSKNDSEEKVKEAVPKKSKLKHKNNIPEGQQSFLNFNKKDPKDI